MRRFLDNGYADIESILKLEMPFTFVLGGRGTGKTYGTLKYVIENNINILLMRRTQTQTDLINKPEFTPFKVLENDLLIDIGIKAVSKYSAAITKIIDDTPFLIGYTCALSTISNLRGFDASEIELLVYDEFIPERHERPLKNEGSAFLNAYETINRNRELKGHKPLQVIALSNAFDIANPLFRELDLIRVCEKMKLKNNNVYVNKSRGVAVIFLDGSEISRKKADTALYKLTTNNNYNEMALNNNFVYNSVENIQSMNLKEFRPICGIDTIYIYKHKSENLYYVSEHKSGVMPYFANDETNINRFISKFGSNLYKRYMSNQFKFENQVAKTIFEWYII